MIKIKVGFSYYIGVDDFAIPYRQASWLLKDLKVKGLQRGIFLGDREAVILIPTKNQLLRVLDLDRQKSWSIEELKMIAPHLEGMIFGRLRSIENLEDDRDYLSSFWSDALTVLKKSTAVYEIISVEDGFKRVGYVLFNHRLYIGEKSIKIMMIEMIQKNEGYGTKAVKLLSKHLSISGLAISSALDFWKKLATSINTQNMFTIKKED